MSDYLDLYGPELFTVYLFTTPTTTYRESERKVNGNYGRELQNVKLTILVSRSKGDRIVQIEGLQDEVRLFQEEARLLGMALEECRHLKKELDDENIPPEEIKNMMKGILNPRELVFHPSCDV